jgi:3D (Asp-Asp-Asp) domain-containing protein
MKNKNYITIVVLVLILLIASISFKMSINSVEQELEATKVNLQLKEDALLDTQKDLQFEMEKSTGLSEKLGTMMGELDELNEMLNVVKSEEYNVAYLGEFVYTYYCDERRPHICGGAGYTASGAPTEVGTTIAVDPTRIPLGSMVYVEGIGLRIAQDTGGAVKGNKIDILLPTHDECFEQAVINGGVWIVSKKTP